MKFDFGLDLDFGFRLEFRGSFSRYIRLRSILGMYVISEYTWRDILYVYNKYVNFCEKCVFVCVNYGYGRC